MQSVAAIVVTYNRKKLLVQCIEALLRQSWQVSRIIIIDNASTDGTAELLSAENYLSNPQVELVRLPHNTGGAGGFHEGVRRGYAAGFGWLWLMDDDAEPEENALEYLMLHANERDVCALAPAVRLPDGKYATLHRRIRVKSHFNPLKYRNIAHTSYNDEHVQIDFASFVGILVKKDVIDKIGLPKHEFFIHRDDDEYSIKIRAIGKILLIPKSIITHNTNDRPFSFDRASYSILWMTYLHYRNFFWLCKKYTKNKLGLLFYVLSTYLARVSMIIICADHKFRRLHLITCSYIDGLTGVFDNAKPRRILKMGDTGK